LQRATARQNRHAKIFPWLIIGVEVGLILVLMLAGVIGLGAIFVYNSGRVLSGVSAFGVDLSAMTVDEAAAALRSAWRDQARLTVRDGERTWLLSPADLGLNLDAVQTALSAGQVGRGEGGLSAGLGSLFAGREIHPTIDRDVARARAGLVALGQYVNIPIKDANIYFNGAEVQTVNALPGREIDVERTLSALAADPGGTLADGELELAMVNTTPRITDVSPAVAMAQQLLGQSFTLMAYDPFADETFNWTIEPDTVAFWLEAGYEDGHAVLSLQDEGPTVFLQDLAASLGNGRTIEVDDALQQMRAAVAEGNLSVFLRVRHPPVHYTVQPGDTFMRISRAFGIPPLMVRDANPNVDPRNLHAGDIVNVPSPDAMVPLPPVLGKRIVIDLSDLHMYVYENGQIIQNWPTSTGIASSPTLPGVFQIRSHENPAYASSWNLWMPHFMGVYEAAPGFMNGIHGLPTRDGRTLIWSDTLGNRNASYGCIVLGTEEAIWLYNWADEGVIVEIRE
jgi:lipoprotein-anchoring transpeptidase ErfK/SrfK